MRCFDSVFGWIVRERDDGSWFPSALRRDAYAHNAILFRLSQVNVSELGLVTTGGKVVWGKYAQVCRSLPFVLTVSRTHSKCSTHTRFASPLSCAITTLLSRSPLFSLPNHHHF
jgi:hypothetical protein